MSEVQEKTVVVEQVVSADQSQETKSQFGAFSSPTPKWASTVFDIIFWASAVVTFALNTLTDVDPHTKDQINQWLLIIMFAARLFSKSFGIVVKDV